MITSTINNLVQAGVVLESTPFVTEDLSIGCQTNEVRPDIFLPSFASSCLRVSQSRAPAPGAVNKVCACLINSFQFPTICRLRPGMLAK